MMIDQNFATGGGIVAVVWIIKELIPVFSKAVKSNGKGSGKDSVINAIQCKPGHAQVCMQRGTLLTQHEETIKHLVEAKEDAKEDRQEIKRKIEKGFDVVFEKLDKMAEKK